MLSFIRKRLPSKDRNNEHIQNIKSNHIEQDDDQMKRTKSTNELDIKKKKKNKIKTIFSSTNNILNPSSPPIDQINKSYSDIDYFPMMPGALSQSINRQETSTNSDWSSDCYLNPSECVQTINSLNYVQTKTMKTRVLHIPVIDCRNEQRVLDYKDVDHQRTKALRGATEQRTKQKSAK